MHNTQYQKMTVIHNIKLLFEMLWVHQKFTFTCYSKNFSLKTSSYVVKLPIKSLKVGQNYGFDPSLRKLSIKSSLASHVLETISKVGVKFLGPPLSTSQTLREF